MSDYPAEREAEKDKGGRPARVFSQEEVTELKALAAVLNKAQLADYFGISEKTLREVESRQPEVSTAYKSGKARAIASIGGNLISQAKSGNTSAAIFYLKTQAGWKEAKEEGVIPEDRNITINIVDAVKPNAD